MSPRITKWIRGLASAFIGGLASPIASQTGIAVANTVGVHIVPLDLKQMGSMAICSGIITAAAYLSKSPLWEPPTGNTGVWVAEPKEFPNPITQSEPPKP